jgi:hypothetical protein
VAGTEAGAGVAAAATESDLEVLALLGARGVLAAASLEGAAAGTGVGAAAGAGEEEVFFAILCWYTLLCEVFLSIFRQYILYSFICLKKCLLLSSKNN